MSDSPLKLTAKCTLGALMVPRVGSINGYFARARQQPDPSNQIPRNAYLQSGETDTSQRLKGCVQSAGGLMPHVNNKIGAPLCTFVYGGIKPGEVHPQINLLKGPPTSFMGTAYAPVFTGDADYSGTIGDGSSSPAFASKPTFVDTVSDPQIPTIPSMVAPPFNASTVLPTYNIWRLDNIGDFANRVTFRGNYGPIFAADTTYPGPWVHQKATTDGGMAIVVTAQNSQALLNRVFPIAADTAYDANAQLYYPPLTNDPTKSVPPRPIKARGGANCGFQLHFTSSHISQMANQTSKLLDGGIRVIWGAQNLPTSGKDITNFKLALIPSHTPKLYFWHPRRQSWVEFPLEGPVFHASGGEFSVYVHYVGPNMLIGFDTDPTTWQAFSPLDDDLDLSKKYTPHTPADARIALVFTNITTTFTYGPAAFNNYHPENLVTSGHPAPNIVSGEDRGTVAVNFLVPNTAAYTGSLSTINDLFLNDRFLHEDLTPNTHFRGKPTFYGDWRINPGSELFFDFAKAKVTPTNSGLDARIAGHVVFDTTIEGPQFLRIINHDADTKWTDRMVRQFSKGDLSPWLKSWKVHFNNEGRNHSLCRGEATVTFVDMDADLAGRLRQTLMNDSQLVLTLSAGYGELQDFFQGMIVDIETTFGASESETKVTLLDVGFGVLERRKFPALHVFTGVAYGDIIVYCMAMAGMSQWYKQTESPLLSDALKLRLGISGSDSGLAKPVLAGVQQDAVYKVISQTMELVINRQNLPTLYWDAHSDTMRLDCRNDPNMLDTLYFAGRTAGNNATLPDPSNAAVTHGSSLHGVLAQGYVEKTHVDQIHSGLLVYAMGEHLTMLPPYIQEDPRAYSEETFNRIESLLSGSVPTDNVPEINFTGFRKTVVLQAPQNLIADRAPLQSYGEQIWEGYARKPYSSLSFTVHVDRPLKHMGRFLLTTMGQSTDPYFYRTVNYAYERDEGKLTAEVQGERLPSMISRPRESVGPRETHTVPPPLPPTTGR